MEHHDLDIYPIPREKAALYINEPWLIDKSIMERVQLVTDLKSKRSIVSTLTILSHFRGLL